MCGGRFTRTALQRRHESQWDLRPVCWLGAATPQRRPHSFLIEINNFKEAVPTPCQAGGGLTSRAKKEWRGEEREAGWRREWWWYKEVRRNRSCHCQSIRHRRLRLTFMLTTFYLFAQTATCALSACFFWWGWFCKANSLWGFAGRTQKKKSLIVLLDSFFF